MRRPGLFISDNLFPEGDDPAASGGAGGGANKPAANGKDHAPAGLTLESAAELITQAQAPLLEKIEMLGEATAKLVQHMARPPADPGRTGKQTEIEQDFLTHFGTDPEAAIRSVLRSELGTLTPLIGNLMNSGASAFVGIEAQQVDAEFGVGAWDKFFAKPMNTILDSYRERNVAALSDRNTITREVNGLKGQQVSQLMEFKTNSTKLTEEQKTKQQKELAEGILKDVTQRTNLTGGIRRIESGAEEITEQVKGYVAERQRAIGGSEDPKAFLERTDYGNSWEDFQAHQKKMKAKGDGK